MYSYEDRIRAVELYIKLGKRVRATIRQLGYPTLATQRYQSWDWMRWIESAQVTNGLEGGQATDRRLAQLDGARLSWPSGQRWGKHVCNAPPWTGSKLMLQDKLA